MNSAIQYHPTTMEVRAGANIGESMVCFYDAKAGVQAVTLILPTETAKRLEAAWRNHENAV